MRMNILPLRVWKDETTSMLKARVNIGHDLSSNATGHWNNDP